MAGRGVRASVDDRTVEVGGPRLLADLGIEASPELAAETERWAAGGASVLQVIADGRVIGALAIEDEIRPESREAVDRLHALGVKVAMITGDSQAVADSVARRLDIDAVEAQVLPSDKASAVRRFQEGGRKVAMVGDGVNDAPALATADVGIAIGAGTDVAVESAGIVLVRSDPRDVVGAIDLSRATYRKMTQNLAWATGYNVVAIPIAAGVLVPWGIDLPMAVGAIAMSVSTIIVAANAQLLRRLRLRPEPAGDRRHLSQPAPHEGLVASTPSADHPIRPAHHGVGTRAPLYGRQVALVHLALVCRKRSQDLALLPLGDLEVVKAAREFSRDFIELLRRDAELAMGFLQTKRRTSRLGGDVFERPTGDVADPQGAHPLQARESVRLLDTPLAQLGVLREFADGWIGDDCIAEVVDNCRDREDATEPLVKA
jgi:soluble P-type ATPase